MIFMEYFPEGRLQVTYMSVFCMQGLSVTRKGYMAFHLYLLIILALNFRKE